MSSKPKPMKTGLGDVVDRIVGDSPALRSMIAMARLRWPGMRQPRQEAFSMSIPPPPPPNNRWFQAKRSSEDSLFALVNPLLSCRRTLESGPVWPNPDRAVRPA